MTTLLTLLIVGLVETDAVIFEKETSGSHGSGKFGETNEKPTILGNIVAAKMELVRAKDDNSNLREKRNIFQIEANVEAEYQLDHAEDEVKRLMELSIAQATQIKSLENQVEIQEKILEKLKVACARLACSSDCLLKSGCLNPLKEICSKFTSDSSHSVQSDWSPPCQDDEVLLITGGIRGDATLSSVEIVDLTKPLSVDVVNGIKPPLSSQIEPLPSSRSGHSVSVVNNSVVLCDGVKGFPGHSPLNSCLQLDAEGKWRLHSTTTSLRRGHSAVVVGGVLHLVGGCASAATFESFVRGEWKERSLPYSIGPGSCSVRASENSVIVTGGLFSLNKAAKWEVKKDEWEAGLPDMLEGKWWHGCEAVQEDGKVFVVVAGGMKDDKGTVVSTSLVLDVGERKWVQMGSLQEGRAAGVMVKLRVGGKSRILMLGGMNKQNKEVDTIEELKMDLEDLSRSKWELMQDVKMNEKRGWFAAVGVEKSQYRL